MGLSGLGEWIKDTINQFADYVKPWALVNEYEEAVILRAGKYHRTLKPGLHPKWPVAEYHLSTAVRDETLEPNSVNITTLDGETVSISGVATFDIYDVKIFLLDNNDSISNMRDIMRAKISEHCEDINWEDIKKKVTRNAVKRSIASAFKSFGVTLKEFEFTDKCKIRAFKIFSGPDKPALML